VVEASQGQQALPPVLELLWGRRERGKRGPRPGLSVDVIVEAAVRVADAEGLEAISMARVAAELGFTTMSLYRYVASKDELLQLMFDASALGAEGIVLEGDDWRAKMRHWAILQRDVLDLHPWITQLPMPAPPMAPNSLHFVEHGLAAFDGTGLADGQKIRVIGLLASYALSDARFAYDAARAARAAAEAAVAAAAQMKPESGGAAVGDTAAGGDGASGDGAGGTGAGDAESGGAVPGGGGEAPSASGEMPTFEGLLRELVDERTYPHLYRLAWSPGPDEYRTEREEYLAGVDLILDGVQAHIDRIAGDSGGPGA
jgi:AcrR family transcriptional regulator